jgi:hypothetical protein
MPYTKVSVKNGKKEVSLVTDGCEIIMHGYRALTFAKYTIIKIVELAVTSGLRSSFD